MTRGIPLMPEDAGGVLLLELLVSGYAAHERGSEEIEPRDLMKAIYIVDLEHVQAFWDDWEGFEAFVSREKLPGARSVYVNRTAYLVRVEIDQNQAPGGSFRGVGKPTEAVWRIIRDARALASERTGTASTPSSRDLLFCACAQDPALSAALQESGLQLERLAAAVRSSGM